MSQPYFGQPEDRVQCPLPPYNTLNFNAESPHIYDTLQHIARTAPNYPLPQDSNADQIYRNTANVSYFTYMNQQTSATVLQNQVGGTKVPYPQFKSEQDRIKYRQGLASASARTLFTGQNPAAPAGVPVSTIYQIITTSNTV